MLLHRDDASSLKSAIDRMILRTSYSRYRSNIKLYTETTRNFMDGYSSFGYVKKSELPSDYRVDSKEGSTCADAFLDIYSQTAITQRYNPGDVIVSLGCFQPNLYHVVSGRVIVTGPDEQPLKEVLEDDLFGEEVFACSSSPGSKFAYVAGTAPHPTLELYCFHLKPS